MKNNYGNIVLVTGASSGIGRDIAMTLAKEGLEVYGTSRKNSTVDGVNMIRMDVGSTESVKSAIEAIGKDVHILINCAGTGITGPLENCTGEDAMEQMNVNYAGYLRTIHEILPTMRKNQKGLIINIGSVGGVFACPFQSLYSSSKAAVEMMTEGLRIEAAPYHIEACTILPGDLRTGFTSNRLYTKESETTEYGEAYIHSIAQMSYDESHGDNPDVVTKVVCKLIGKKHVPVRVTIGMQYKLLVFLRRLLPLKLIEKILIKVYPHSKRI